MIAKLSEAQIKENLNRFYSYIDQYISPERAAKLKEFYKKNELTLATSPAATKVLYHSCYPGGYVQHILNVVEYALVVDRVWDKFGQIKDYTLEELVFSAINHDLGKLGTDEQPYYLPNDVQWQIDKGTLYKYNPKLPHMRIPDRSLYYLQQAGISMSEREYLAIKLHDGLYEEANKPYYINYDPEFQIESNLIYILHQADLMASRIEKQKDTKK
jgi:hypothetical protein